MKKIFSYNSDFQKNAYMNWRTDYTDSIGRLATLADGFALGANKLMESILIDNTAKEADALIFPIMHAIDHSIELYLKAILYEIKTTPKATHDIKSLFEKLKEKIKEQENETQDLDEHLQELESYIEELYTHIKSNEDDKVNIDFARYPFDIKQNPHFYIRTTKKITENVVIDIQNLTEELTENVVIDIQNLKERFANICEILNGLYLMYLDRLEAETECHN